MNAQTKQPCPWLPDPHAVMSFRDLQSARAESVINLHRTACQYANYLWLKDTPARAILALCRALYLIHDGGPTPAHAHSAWLAYVWFLGEEDGRGFLGNPRVSFSHQATRMRPPVNPLNNHRAWALWHLTRIARPDLPPDPGVAENAPSPVRLQETLSSRGFPGEGDAFQEAIGAASKVVKIRAERYLQG